MNHFLLAHLYSLSFSLQEDSSFMEAVGHSSQPSRIEKGIKDYELEKLWHLKKTGGKA